MTCRYFDKDDRLYWVGSVELNNFYIDVHRFDNILRRSVIRNNSNRWVALRIFANKTPFDYYIYREASQYYIYVFTMFQCPFSIVKCENQWKCVFFHRCRSCEPLLGWQLHCKTLTGASPTTALTLEKVMPANKTEFLTHPPRLFIVVVILCDVSKNTYN